MGGADDAGDDEADGDRGDCGGVVCRDSGCFREEVFQRKAEAYGEDDDLQDGEEHADRIEGDLLTDEEEGQCRGEDWGKQGGDGGHGDGVGEVALAHVGDDVARRAAGAGAEEDEAGGEARLKGKERAKGEGEEWHDGVLRERTEEDVARTAEDDEKVLEVKRGAHAEHDDAEQYGEDGDALDLA